VPLTLRSAMAPALALAAVTVLAAAATGPDALVGADRGFARDAAARGVRAAFLDWLAPTAVVFEPEPVNGRKYYAAQPADASRLAWEPVVAELSADGDLGWTTGPWEWRSDSSRARPQVTGEYVTLWRRQADGSLKVVLDMGVPHPPAADHPALQANALAAVHARHSALGERHGLWKADADFGITASAQGLPAALAATAAPDVRWLHSGMAPVLGRDAVRDSAATRVGAGRMTSQAQFIADSGDLGYTHGVWVEGAGAAADTSYYLHIWRRSPGRPWELALELLLPVPPARKS